ncbi:unnamed protein product [marine sediment metagenome]|uniref:DUF3426 domain-containing protein n=1 Tax=marine sediment metagenome TaxID=412755 RepID=X1PNQ1_9ZZZZ
MKILIKSLVAMALVAILIPSFTGCTETQYEPGEGGAPPVTEKLEILSHSMSTTQFGNLVVKGTAKNVSSSTLSYAEVRVKFYDAAGTLLSTSLANINDLSAGETWSFEVMYLDIDIEKVTSYKIGVGSTF